jgi:hypothetical protein
MATVDTTSRRIRAAAGSHSTVRRHGGSGFRRPRTRLEKARAAGRLMLTLGLIVIAISELGYVLDIVDGWFH